MQMHDATSAARTVIDDFEITSQDEGFDYHQALVSDEEFGAAAYLYQEARIYADGEHAVEANADAVDALQRAVREHAQRVREEVGVDE